MGGLGAVFFHLDLCCCRVVFQSLERRRCPAGVKYVGFFPIFLVSQNCHRIEYRS